MVSDANNYNIKSYSVKALQQFRILKLKLKLLISHSQKCHLLFQLLQALNALHRAQIFDIISKPTTYRAHLKISIGTLLSFSIKWLSIYRQGLFYKSSSDSFWLANQVFLEISSGSLFNRIIDVKTLYQLEVWEYHWHFYTLYPRRLPILWSITGRKIRKTKNQTWREKRRTTQENNQRHALNSL